MKTTLIAVGVLMGLLFMLPAQAQEGDELIDDTLTEDVSLNEIVVNGCGPQAISLSGTANYAYEDTRLMVSLDGSSLLTSTDAVIWEVASTTITPGTHTVTAILSHDTSSIPPIQDTQSFEVPACPSSEGSRIEEAPPVTPSAPTKQVKGTRTVGVSAADRKAPDFIKNATVPQTVGRIFKDVFGRKITPTESTYWKARARSDKATKSKLRGAMRWHKLNKK